MGEQNDHEVLRSDPASRTALSRDEVLASPSTLCRWENRASRETAVAPHEVIVESFIASHEQAPRRLILDVDATDDRVHGNQEGRFFHGHYDHYSTPAYSGPKLPLNPEEGCHPFHAKAATDSTAKLPPWQVA